MDSVLPPPRNLATAVIGAGPAGLLFCVVGRILLARRGLSPGDWPLRLYDKREAYARTHRLRMAPEPYLAIQRDLADPRFDDLISFLEGEDFRPEVNLLEEKLEALAAELGVRKEVLTVGPAPPAVRLPELRRRVEEEGALAPSGRFTIVAADSVHSAVREDVRGPLAPLRHVHQRVARLRVTGPDLPPRLGLIEQVKLSKVLGSILDYRLNKNGFAEIDLFLAPPEHAAVSELGATPKAPLPLRASRLSTVRAPLFRRIVEHLERGFGGGPCEVLLQSSFQLEHAVMPRLVIEHPAARATVFLVGDAAVSLPFFRGMACLARCVHSLAHVHCDLAALEVELRDPGARARAEEDMQRSFFAKGRPTRFGAWALPGRIREARATIVRGERAFVVLHGFLGRHGAHVLARDAEGQWHGRHHLAPVGRRAAEEDFARWSDPARRYDLEADAVKRSELSVVRARARLIALVRELVRVSALLPFPIQSWFLSAPESRRTADPSPRGVQLNAGLALVAAALGLGGPALAALGSPWAAWLAVLALPVQAAGGVAYHAVHTLTPGPHGRLRAVWRAQTIALFLGGIPLAVLASRSGGSILQAFSASAWLLLAAMFVVGLYVYERVVARWLARSDGWPG